MPYDQTSGSRAEAERRTLRRDDRADVGTLPKSALHMNPKPGSTGSGRRRALNYAKLRAKEPNQVDQECPCSLAPSSAEVTQSDWITNCFRDRINIMRQNHIDMEMATGTDI